MRLFALLLSVLLHVFEQFLSLVGACLGSPLPFVLVGFGFVSLVPVAVVVGPVSFGPFVGLSWPLQLLGLHVPELGLLAAVC